MKILAFEYACASGSCGDTFLRDGRLMLVSLLEELASAELGEVTTLVNRALDTNGITPDETVVIDGSFFTVVERQMENADVVWIVAPESRDILYRLAEMGERLGKKVIGSSAEALKLCGDKLSLARFLSGKIETPESVPFARSAAQAGVRPLRGTPVPLYYNTNFPCVVKPVDGAGSENIYFVNDKKKLRQIKIESESYLIQPYVEGEKLSAGIVSGGGTPLLLGVCRQEIELSERLKLKSVAGPIDYANREKLIVMIEKINRLIPALSGYWGIDFIDCGGRLTLIEINPRLTTSYPIYAKACGFNIAEKVLNAVTQTWLA